MHIFAETAPKFWAKNIPVIPLLQMSKRPAIPRWQSYADVMPSVEEQAAWLGAFPNGNIGLPLGPCSGIVAADFDTDDEKILSLLGQIIPKSPWVRVGQRGNVQFFRWNGERTFNILLEGKTIFQCLSKGAQVVLPPSIHPDTQMPYVQNTELLGVIDELPLLPGDLQREIRDILNDNGFNVGHNGSTKVSVFVPAGARDNSMVSFAGVLARGIVRGERTLMECMGEMTSWVENLTAKVVGDELSVDKGHRKIVEFLLRDVTGEKGVSLPEGWDEGLTDEDKKNLGLEFGIDRESWSFERIKDYLMDQFTANPEVMSRGWLGAVEVILGNLANNKNDLNQDRILKLIVDQSAGALSISTLRRKLKQLESKERVGESHSEIAGYVIKDLTPFGEIRSDGVNLFQWKGANWEKMDRSNLESHVAVEYGEFPAARRRSDHKGIIQVMAGMLKKELNQHDKRGLNFANGFLTEDLELKPHNPDFGCTYVLPYRYLPERAGHCPQFMQLLHDSWGEDPDFKDKVDALQEAIAATMFGLGPEYQRVICLYGEAGSGKSRVLEIVRGLLPDDCTSNVAPHLWDQKFLPTQLFKKQMNICGELSESKLIAGDTFKNIIEGGTINGEYKGGQIFPFKPYATHWFSGNHLPRSRDYSEGFIRRWLFLKFNNPVPTWKKVIDIDKIILAAEREEICAWAAEGVRRLKRNNGFTLPTTHMVLIDQVANDINSVRYFLTSCRRLKMASGECLGTTLYDIYYRFCLEEQAARVESRRMFHKKMGELQHLLKFKQRIEDGGNFIYSGIIVL